MAFPLDPHRINREKIEACKRGENNVVKQNTNWPTVDDMFHIFNLRWSPVNIVNVYKRL